MHSRPFLFACSLTIAVVGVAACLNQSLRAEATPKPVADDIKLERVPPVEADKALDTLQIADGFRIEQVASEPEVVDPVAMAFDEHCQLYVVEMRDYSERDKEHLGRIRLLSDEDGDGRFEKSRV